MGAISGLTEQQGEIQAYHQEPGGVPAVREAMERLKSIRTFVAEELKPKVDYGVIPGTGTKQVMLLPGAQKVAMYLNVYPDYGITATELGDGHVEYLVKTDLISRATERKVGSGIGSCSTKEGKYRYRSGERKCPECDKPTIIKGKEEFGGGWLCFKKKGGCGAKFEDGDRAIEAQQVGKVENDNIHDQRNTVLKMAKKRSVVDAAIGLACLADLFTQDIEDTYDLSEMHAPAQDPAKAEVNASFRPKEPAPATTTPSGDDVPRTGKALFAWVKDAGQRHDVGLLKYLNGWAKLQEFPSRMLDWDADQVAYAYEEAVRKLRSVRPAAAGGKGQWSGPGREQDRGEAPGLDLHNWLERERTRIGRNITKWARRWSDEQGFPPDWSTLTAEQADAIHAAAKAKIETFRQEAPERASQEPKTPAEQESQAPTRWAEFLGEALDRWHGFDPIATPEDRVKREHQFAHGLVTLALNDERLRPADVNKPDGKTRDPARAWEALKRIFAEDRDYLRETADYYLESKETELKARKELAVQGIAN